MNSPIAAGIVRMRIDGDALSFLVPGEDRTVEVGSLAPARKLLRHQPVTAAELEALIEAIEELVMPALRELPAATRLEVATGDFDDLARTMPASTEGRQEVGIDEVERLFNRLADVASGSPVTASGQPPDASFALRLALLREVMHHGGFARVTLLR